MCFLKTIIIAISIYSDTPQSIAIEDCNGVDRYSTLSLNQEVEIVQEYLDMEIKYVYKIKEIK